MAEDFLTSKEALERIVRLETALKERCESNDRALQLAREIMAKDLELARNQMESRMEGHNQWQSRWDKREAILATKADVELTVKALLGLILIILTIVGLLFKFS
jgi:hypothetical protein